MATTKIVLNRQSDLILTGAKIEAPIGLKKADIAELVADLQSLGQADAAEAISRAQGDADLQAAIEAAEASLNAAILSGDAAVTAALNAYQASNDAALDSETSSRIAGDNALQTNLDAEVARAEAAEEGLMNDISALETELAADVATLQSNIDNEQSRAEAAEASLSSAISTEEAARIAGDAAGASALNAYKTSNDSTISAMDAAYKAADSGLQSKIDAEKARIDAILTGASANADNFAEIVALINSVDTTNDQAFASYVLSNDAALEDEIQARTSGDAELASDLADETAARISADNQLDADLDAEVSRATAAEGSLDSKIDQEIADRTAADTGFTNSLNNEIADRISGDQTVQTNLDAETQRATSAEGVLRTDLNTEISDRISAVSDEEAARIAGDNALQLSINSVESVGASALASAVSDLESADVTLQSNIYEVQSNLDSYVLSNDGVISAMDAAYKAADLAGASALASAVSDLEFTDRSLQSNIDGVQSNLDSYITSNDEALAAGLAEEHQHHIDGDAAVTTAFEAADAQIKLDFAKADTDIIKVNNEQNKEIAVLKGRTDNLELGLTEQTDRIDAILDGSTVDLDQFKEVVDFVNSIDLANDEALLTAVTNLNSAISDEESARIAADNLVRTDFADADAAVTAAFEAADADIIANYESADILLQSNLDTVEDTLTLAIGDETAAREAADLDINGRIDNLNTSEVAENENFLYFTEDRVNGTTVAEGELLSDFVLNTKESIDELRKTDAELDKAIESILSNTDLTALDSFTEVISDVNKAFVDTYKGLDNYIIKNRPTMLGFNESPDGTITDFTADVVEGTHIVFLNGLMLREGADYTVSHDGTTMTVSYLDAPASTDRVDVYGVSTGTDAGSVPSIGKTKMKSAD